MSGARYHAGAVNAAIASSNRAGRRIGGKEARLIHALLQGRAPAPVAPAPTITGYTVTNRSTGRTTSYKTRAAASRAADAMDNAYGAYICTVRAVWSDEA